MFITHLNQIVISKKQVYKQQVLLWKCLGFIKKNTTRIRWIYQKVINQIKLAERV